MSAMATMATINAIMRLQCIIATWGLSVTINNQHPRWIDSTVATRSKTRFGPGSSDMVAGIRYDFGARPSGPSNQVTQWIQVLGTVRLGLCIGVWISV